MDKLVKLLNEYERERQGLPKDFEDYTMWNIVGNEIVQSSCDPDSREYFKYYIISKDYQFIKWLIENDKIDRNRVLISFTMSESDGLGNYYGHGVECYQSLLMLLSISDTPIDDLISYLR